MSLKEKTRAAAILVLTELLQKLKTSSLEVMELEIMAIANPIWDGPCRPPINYMILGHKLTMRYRKTQL